MNADIDLAPIILLLFFAVHLWSRRLEAADDGLRGPIFSAAGGVSAAYVFVHLLPELRRVEEPILEPLSWLPAETAIYVLSLAGMVAFFGLERLVVRAGAAASKRPGSSDVALPLFWTHVGAFALYSFVIGFMLVEERDRHPADTILFGLALAVHFMVSDHALRRRHPMLHARHGRLVLAVAVVAGWSVGTSEAMPKQLGAALFALLAGGIIFNVIKEELPPTGTGSYTMFVAGAASYILVFSLIQGFS